MNKNQIVMIHGTDYVQMTVDLLEAIHLDEIIGAHSRRVALKPNLLHPDKAENGAVTHPELVEGVLRYLGEHHFSNVCVIEGAWVGARTSQAVEVSGVADICRKYQVPFLDLQKDSSYVCDACGMQLKLCSEVAKTEFLINLPVLKGHCQTRITCAMKNAKGVIPNSEKRRFHTLGLHKPIAHLNTVLPPQLVLVDNICGDLNFEEGGNPVVMNRIFACLDPVLCDAYVCECIGYSVDEVPYIPMAARLGAGNADTSGAELVMLNQPSGTLPNMRASRRIQKLEAYTDARDACSACYGSLIFALERLESAGEARGKYEKIRIGQGWKKENDGSGSEPEATGLDKWDGSGIGVGNCTHGCRKHLPGCPPKARDIVEFLKENWQ